MSFGVSEVSGGDGGGKERKDVWFISRTWRMRYSYPTGEVREEASSIQEIEIET